MDLAQALIWLQENENGELIDGDNDLHRLRDEEFQIRSFTTSTWSINCVELCNLQNTKYTIYSLPKEEKCLTGKN